jgi:hypothetical protein
MMHPRMLRFVSSWEPSWPFLQWHTNIKYHV